MASLATGVALVRRMFRALAFVGDSAQFLHDSDYTTRFLPVGQPEIDRLIGVYNRMVDSLRAERQRVQEQHYFLGRVLDVSPSGIVVLDLDGADRPRQSGRGAAAAARRGGAARAARSRRPDVPLLAPLASLAPGESARRRRRTAAGASACSAARSSIAGSRAASSCSRS